MSRNVQLSCFRFRSLLLRSRGSFRRSVFWEFLQLLLELWPAEFERLVDFGVPAGAVSGGAVEIFHQSQQFFLVQPGVLKLAKGLLTLLGSRSISTVHASVLSTVFATPPASKSIQGALRLLGVRQMMPALAAVRAWAI
jgi:hypothetical protein